MRNEKINTQDYILHFFLHNFHSYYQHLYSTLERRPEAAHHSNVKYIYDEAQSQYCWMFLK